MGIYKQQGQGKERKLRYTKDAPIMQTWICLMGHYNRLEEAVFTGYGG